MTNEHEIYVYGASDDLIEVGGDVSAEFYANFDAPTHVIIGETEIVVEYDGEWHLSVVDEGEDDEIAWYSVGRDQVAEELNDYTEAIVVESPEANASKVDE